LQLIGTTSFGFKTYHNWTQLQYVNKRTLSPILRMHTKSIWYVLSLLVEAKLNKQEEIMMRWRDRARERERETSSILYYVIDSCKCIYWP